MRRVSCGLATSVMSVIALAGAPAEPQLAVFVVIETMPGYRDTCSRAPSRPCGCLPSAGCRHSLDSSAVSSGRQTNPVPEPLATDGGR